MGLFNAAVLAPRLGDGRLNARGLSPGSEGDGADDDREGDCCGAGCDESAEIGTGGRH